MDQDSEKLFKDWHNGLGALYKEAEAELTPILQSLKTVEDRYGEKVLIGKGGEKSVYRVFDTLTRRQVALAEAHEDTLDKHEHFLREALILSSLQHPNIIPLYDLGLTAEKPYFTMELVKGDKLEDLIGKQSTEDLLEIFLQICDAISYAHSQNILNLDLKPENIVIGEFSKVQVIDWGLAYKIDAPQIRKTCGTPGFMAPEQISNSQLSMQTDIYLLGGLLYSILYGEPPVSGKSLSEILRNTELGHSKLEGKTVIRSLDYVLKKALATAPVDRYESVLSFKNEILRFRQGFAPIAENASFSKQMYLLYKRHKAVTLSIISAFLFIVAFTFLFVKNIKESETRALKAQQQAEELLLLYESEKKLSSEMQAGIQEALKNTLARGQLEEEVNKLIMSSTRRLSAHDNYEAAKMFIFELLKKKPDYHDAWQHLGFIYFVEQKFDKASQALRNSKLPDCWEIAELSQELHARYGDRKMTIDEVADLYALDFTGNKKWGWCLKNLPGYYNSPQDFNRLASLIEKILQRINPGSTIVFDYNRKKKTLSLQGSEKIQTVNCLYIPEINYLNFLPIDKLDIKNLPDLHDMQGLKPSVIVIH